MKNYYHFAIVVEQDKNGYFVSCPELQGCYSQGQTYEEALKNIRDAIKLHLDDRAAEREIIPTGRSVSVASVAVAA